MLKNCFEREEMKISRSLPIYLATGIVIVVLILPIYWMFVTSIKNLSDVFAVPPKLLFFEPTLTNYIENFSGPTSQLRPLINSIVVAGCNSILATVLGALIAYGSVYFKIKAKNHFLFWILSLRMLPPIAFSVPLFLIARRIYLIDTHFVLILIYCLFNVPLATWLLRSSFSEIPVEIREAAVVDGATEYQVFSKLILPLSTSSVVVTLILTAMFAWNEFLLALVLTTKIAKTIPVSITSFWSTMQINWGAFAAVGTVMFIPLMIIALVLQKWLVRGLTFGAVKG